MSPATPARVATIKAMGTAVAAMLAVAGLALAARPVGGSDDATRLETLLTAAAEATESVGSAHVEVTGNAVVKVRLDLDRFLAEMPSIDEVLEQMEAELPELPQFPEPSAQDGDPRRPGVDPGALSIPTLPDPDCTGLDDQQCAALRESHRQAAEAIGNAQEDARHLVAGDAGPDADSGADRDALRDEMRAQLEAGRDAAREQLASAQAQFEQQLAEVPREFTCRFTFNGSGTLAIPGQVEIGGDADVTCDPETPDASSTFHVVISHDVTYTDNGDGTFTAAPTGGDIGALLARAEDLAAMVDEGSSTPTDHGTETLDGVEVRHLSFAVDGGPFAPVDGATASVDVWVGVDDHVLRKAVVRSAGAHEERGLAVEWTAEQTILVTDVDVPAEITRPSPEQVVPAAPAAKQFQGMTSPFGPTMPVPFAGSGGA